MARRTTSSAKVRVSADAIKFAAQERRNWGYWDGRSARERNRYPEWAKPSVYRCAHPFDSAYGEGFWAGWYGDQPPPGAVI